MIILKVTKNQDFTRPLETIFLENPHLRDQIEPPVFLGLNRS